MLRHSVGQVNQMLGQRLWIVCEMPRGLTMHWHHVHTEGFKQLGHRDTPGGIHRIHSDRKLGSPDEVGIHKRQIQNVLHVTVQPRIVVGGLAVEVTSA